MDSWRRLIVLRCAETKGVQIRVGSFAVRQWAYTIPPYTKEVSECVLISRYPLITVEIRSLRAIFGRISYA
jgi:hypothetical protein